MIQACCDRHIPCAVSGVIFDISGPLALRKSLIAVDRRNTGPAQFTQAALTSANQVIPEVLEQQMRVLVTGGAGFIGSHVVDGLIAKGHKPFVVDDFSTGDRQNLPGGVPVFDVDVCDGPRLAAIFDEVQPEWVCHQAAQMSVSRSMREPVFDAKVNIIGLLEVLENSARCGVSRVVFASSGGVLYGDVVSPAPESTDPRPISPYGIAKWVGEQYLQFYARERGLKGVALRYANVFGPRQNPHGEAGVVAIFSTRLLAGEQATINGDGKYVRDYVYVTDVARANLLALEAELPEQFVAINIGTAHGTDVNELEQQVREQVQGIWRRTGRQDIVPACGHGPARIGDLRSNLVCPDFAQQILGWRPEVQFKDGIQQTVDWFARRSTGSPG